MASPGNRHCANCIGALSFRVWLIPHDHSLPRVTCLSAQRFMSLTRDKELYKVRGYFAKSGEKSPIGIRVVLRTKRPTFTAASVINTKLP